MVRGSVEQDVGPAEGCIRRETGHSPRNSGCAGDEHQEGVAKSEAVIRMERW